MKLQDPDFSGDLVAAGDDESVVELQNGTLSGVAPNLILVTSSLPGEGK